MLKCLYSQYGGNPVSMSVGLAVLDVIEEEGLIKHAKDTGDVFLEKLNLLKKQHECIGDVRFVVVVLYLVD